MQKTVRVYPAVGPEVNQLTSTPPPQCFITDSKWSTSYSALILIIKTWLKPAGVAARILNLSSYNVPKYVVTNREHGVFPVACDDATLQLIPGRIFILKYCILADSAAANCLDMAKLTVCVQLCSAGMSVFYYLSH